MPLEFRYSGGRFRDLTHEAVKDHTPQIKAAGLSERSVLEAVELILAGEPDRALLRLQIRLQGGAKPE